MDKILCVSEIISPSVISHNRWATKCDELRYMKTRLKLDPTKMFPFGVDHHALNVSRD